MEINKFEQMEINEELKKAIKKMGFEEATPIQAKAIPTVLEGKDFIGIAQTGTGKTCAFGVPVINKIDTFSNKVQALILCPTRELVIQTCEELKSLAHFTEGLKIVPIYGGQQIERQISALKGKPQIIVGTPGRIMDHMRRKTIKFDTIDMLVLDEADEMLNMGFREDLDVILEKSDKNRQTILFSATMSKDILNITKKYQKEDVVKLEIAHKNLTAPKIKQYMIRVQENKKLEVLTRIIDAEEINLSLIFCNTKRKVDELVESLSARGYQIEALHGDMRQSQRDTVMKKFRNNKLNVLVATDVAARGIDVDDIEVVFNYDLPVDEEYYVHRIGRTGRAGRDGKSISFVTPREMYKARDIQKYTNAPMAEYEIPSSKDANDKKYLKLFNDATKLFEENDLSEETKMIEQYLENIEMNVMDLAASLVKLSLKGTIGDIKDLVLQDKDFERKDRGESNRPDRTRLFMTVGKLDELTRNTLKDFIVEQAGIDRSDIHDAEVLDKFSFVTLSNEAAKTVITKLNNTKYGERKLCIEESTKTQESRPRSNFRSNRRSDDKPRFRSEGRSNDRSRPRTNSGSGDKSGFRRR
ncbi:MAG: helicase, superfamily [Clostridia bacterium]|jgi:ATP-dependent RNA helicase DeaD|nr:helicase, superfamily [Clostridia bacterium]